MEFHEILSLIMQEKGLSIPDVARLCGLTDSTVRSIIDRHQKKIALSVAFKLSEGLGVSLQRLNGMPEPVSPHAKQKNAAPKVDTAGSIADRYKKLDEHGKLVVCAVISEEERRMSADSTHVIELFPMRHYIQPASAGLGDFNDDTSYDVVDLVKRPPAGASFLVTVHGDSMEPTYRDGQWVFIRAQETLQHGDVGLFAIGADLYIKEYGIDGLVSHNPAYAVLRPPVDTPARIYGKVLGACSRDYFR